MKRLKRLYKTEKSRFSSLLSLVFLVSMVLVFLMVLPEFLSISAGRIFAGLWAVMAIFVFTAHAREMSTERRILKSPFSIAAFEKKDVRTNKANNQNIVRGYKGLG